MSRVALRRIQLVLLWTAILMTGLCAVLVLAAWRDDHTIDRDKGAATAEVLSAGPRRSTISFYTPDGVNHNPPLGVLYPSSLTVGDRIQVEYSRSNPDLVRVAGRTASVAVFPAISVAVGTWLVIGAVMVLLAVGYRRGSGDGPAHAVTARAGEAAGGAGGVGGPRGAGGAGDSSPDVPSTANR